MTTKTDKKTFFVTGTAMWAKVLGEPRMDQLAGRKMWSVDVYPEDPKAFAKDLKTYKINKQLKDKEDGPCITFTRNELTRDGNKMSPIPIYGPDNSPWDANTLIGNGSEVTVRFKLNQSLKYGNIVWVEAIKVLDHKPYIANMFPDDKDDDDGQAGQGASEEFLDDDVPF